MEINAYTLATLKRGQKGVIKSVDSSDPQVQRLMVLGLVKGAEIEHASAAIGGDPIEFRLGMLDAAGKNAQCAKMMAVNIWSFTGIVRLLM